MIELVHAYRRWAETEELMAGALRIDVTLRHDEMRALRERELDLLKSGAHNSWTAWLYGTAAAAAVALFFFAPTPVTGVGLGAVSFQMAHALDGLTGDHRKTQSEAEQKRLGAKRFLEYKAVELHASQAADMSKAMQSSAEIMRRLIANM